jgi:hypothetical protein
VDRYLRGQSAYLVDYAVRWRAGLRIPMMSTACSGAMSATGSKIMSAGRSD